MLAEANLTEAREECAACQGWSIARWTGEATGLAAEVVAEHGRARGSTLLNKAFSAIAQWGPGTRWDDAVAPIIRSAHDRLASWDQRSEAVLIADAANLALERPRG